MVWRADDVSQRGSVKLGRQVERDGDGAQQRCGPWNRHLKAVNVDEPDRSVPGHQDRALVDIPDHQASGMHGRERPGQVGGDVHKKAPVRVGEVLAAAARSIEVVDVLSLLDDRQQESARLAARVEDQAGGPSGELLHVGARKGGEDLDLAGSLGGQRR